MTESFKTADTPETRGVAGEEFRDGLVGNYLCATTPDGEEKALKALRKDEFRLAMAGMTPEQRELWNNLDRVDWKAVQREGLTAVMPTLFGGYIGLTSSPEDATRIATALGSAGFGLEMLSVAAAVPEAMARHQRASGLAKVIAAVRVGTFYAGKVGLFTALGTGVAGLVHRSWEAQAAQPGAAGGGEQVGSVGAPADQPSPVEDWTGVVGGATEGGGQPPVGGGTMPVPEAAPGNVLPHLGGEIPAEDLLSQPGDAEVITQQVAEAAEAARQAALETATLTVTVNPGDTLTDLVARVGGDAYGADFTNTVLQSADVLTGYQNPNRDMAQALIDFIKAHPDGVNWRDAINGAGDWAKEMVGGVPLKDAIAQATRMIYPGQEIKVVVGAALQ